MDLADEYEKNRICLESRGSPTKSAKTSAILGTPYITLDHKRQLGMVSRSLSRSRIKAPLTPEAPNGLQASHKVALGSCAPKLL
jgi:hypothetical protein